MNLELLDRRQTRRRVTLGADKAYKVVQFVHDLRHRSVTPHIDGEGGGEFAFGCVTGTLCGAADADTIDFTWDDSVEIDEVCSQASAQLWPDGILEREIHFHRGDNIAFAARRWQASSTNC